ncbi:P1 family peptidase [Paeniglutamicibacter cryotolerans]|uniref:L-aminopeptidase/D-esterase-like protein n=1 Tax=Paeniglutamicibacter cryotolerans TaxID=670079 RepID=A0A839QHD4_9MICC|nr:P1 family peptidase [Paeniglutamicibacter cryotolerans]MBB2995778.1 L-aminopeptidase/D-esterase-like protein [Paeniglutamicibacter cryotolerans]
MTVRARDLGIELDGVPGEHNAITDVPGITVGYVTLDPGDGSACTGVTAILPRGHDGVGVPCSAGTYSLNGNGEMTGRTWIEESGQFSTPIMITNSHSVGACHTGVNRWMHENHPRVSAQWMLPVVAETWDGYLNRINDNLVTPEHAAQALDAAVSGPLAEGSVGGGTGMNCYGFKGGSGTASRKVRACDTDYTLGVFLQANFGSRKELRINGVPVGRTSQAPCPMQDTDWFTTELAAASSIPGGSGSVIVIVATDAPLLPAQAKALARRVPMGLARTGTTGGHFSGDIFLAFSTANQGSLVSNITMGGAGTPLDSLEFLPWAQMDGLYTATVEAVEEAVLNALVNNHDVTGRDGHFSPALPHAEVIAGIR